MKTLQKLRKDLDLSIYDVQFVTGIQPARISLIERGYGRPRPHEKQLLAAALGLKADEISWLSVPVPKRGKRTAHPDATGSTIDEPGQEQAT